MLYFKLLFTFINYSNLTIAFANLCHREHSLNISVKSSRVSYIIFVLDKNPLKFPKLCNFWPPGNDFDKFSKDEVSDIPTRVQIYF